MIDKFLPNDYYAAHKSWCGVMDPKYGVGQKVIIAPVGGQTFSPRDTDLESCVGQVGQITDYHWISTGLGREVFYIYTVQTVGDRKQVVLHEDELRSTA